LFLIRPGQEFLEVCLDVMEIAKGRLLLPADRSKEELDFVCIVSFQGRPFYEFSTEFLNSPLIQHTLKFLRSARI
jgi:hypothetical protein